MSELYPTQDELLAAIQKASPDAQVRVAKIKAWLSLEQKRLGLDADSSTWLWNYHRRKACNRLSAQLDNADDEAIDRLWFEEQLEETCRKSQAEDVDPIVKVRRPDGEITYWPASKLMPGADILPGQSTGGFAPSPKHTGQKG